MCIKESEPDFLCIYCSTCNRAPFSSHSKTLLIFQSARPIKFGPGVRPISLPSFADADLPENVAVTGSGWGAVERKRNKKSTYTLHKIVLLTVDRESCKDRIMASKNKIGSRQICTNLPAKAGMCFVSSFIYLCCSF